MLNWATGALRLSYADLSVTTVTGIASACPCSDSPVQLAMLAGSLYPEIMNAGPCAGRVGLLFACLVMFAVGCSGTTNPTPISNITFGQPSPASGSTILTTGTPPGAFIPRGSGRLSVPLTITSGRDVPWAQLYVYLLSPDFSLGYCGQNLPDAPTWGPFEKGQTVSVTITGFQVYPASCNVTGFRAILHSRNNGLLIPPTASETVAEATLTASYVIRQ